MNLDQGELRRLIGVRNKELEAFPRQNKNCIEYYEKYKLKYEELDSKFTQQQRTEDQITELLNALKEKKAKSIEENFKLLSKNFTEIFRDIVKDGTANLKLVKQDLSQQTEQSQFPDGTQALSIGDSLYKGIKVHVSFSGESSQEDDLTLSRLSGGQKAVVAACLIFAIQQIEAAPFYIMDEFDSALDP